MANPGPSGPMSGKTVDDLAADLDRPLDEVLRAAQRVGVPAWDGAKTITPDEERRIRDALVLVPQWTPAEPAAGHLPARIEPDRYAVFSLVSALTAIVVPIVPGLLAIYLGIAAKRRISQSGVLAGSGLATAGIVLGAVFAAVWAAVIIGVATG